VDNLGIVADTVKYHTINSLYKTGYKKTTQLAVEAVSKGLVLPRF